MVAIKVFKIEDSDADAAALRACAAMEIRILQQLHHANIVTYLEVCTLAEPVYHKPGSGCGV